jgi:glycerol transport system ATP-binding protein
LTLVLESVGQRGLDGETHLEAIDLELPKGSLTVLLGPVGAGKTTLLRWMAGLEAPSAGQVLLDGRELQRVPPRERNVGFVHQKFVNYPGRKVFENVAAPLRQSGWSAAETEARVQEVTRLLHIDSLLQRRPDELSGGQQQRTALARALARPGGLLLLDEPLANLDYKLREELREELRSLFARGDATIAYATSDPAEALALGGRTVVLDCGRVQQQGDALEVYRRPESARVGELTSVPPMNLIPGRCEEGRLRVGAHSVAAAPHLAPLGRGAYRIGVRPHHLSLERRSPVDLALEAQVELAELSGSETFLHLRLEIEGGTACIAHQTGTWPHALGERLQIFLDARRVYAFAEDGALVAAPGD